MQSIISSVSFKLLSSVCETNWRKGKKINPRVLLSVVPGLRAIFTISPIQFSLQPNFSLGFPRNSARERSTDRLDLLKESDSFPRVIPGRADRCNSADDLSGIHRSLSSLSIFPLFLRFVHRFHSPSPLYPIWYYLQDNKFPWYVSSVSGRLSVSYLQQPPRLLLLAFHSWKYCVFVGKICEKYQTSISKRNCRSLCKFIFLKIQIQFSIHWIVELE